MMKPMLFSGLSDIPNILNPDQGYYSGKAVQREWAGYQKSNPMNKMARPQQLSVNKLDDFKDQKNYTTENGGKNQAWR